MKAPVNQKAKDEEEGDKEEDDSDSANQKVIVYDTFCTAMSAGNNKSCGPVKTSGNIEKDFKDAKKVQKISQTDEVRQLFSLVLKRGSGAKQHWWMISIAALVVVKTMVMSRVAMVHSSLNHAIHSRDGLNFRKAMLRNILLMFGSNFIEQSIKLAQGRLALIWQTKLTHLLHRKYFTTKNFYNIGGEQYKKINDADQRISNDVREATVTMANVVCQAMTAAWAGLYFGASIRKEMGFSMIAVPYLLQAFNMWWTEKVCPLDWRRLEGLMEFTFGDYRNSHSRLLMNSEAVAALKGTEVEKSILMKKLEKTEGVQRRFWDALLPFLFLEHVAFNLGPMVFIPLPVMAHLLFQGLSSLTTKGAAASRAETMATVTYRMSIFGQVMSSASGFASAYKELQRLGGNCARVTTLLEALQKMQADQEKQHSTNFVEGSGIEFKGVDVVTPNGNRLVENLSFKVDPGVNLMITGHNGAGKSSIFRCLGGLWDIPKGTIVKPGAGVEGLHEEVFYLPQKPYNVLGTLVDQLTYPDTGGNAKSLSRTELVELLSKVDLGYLSGRDGVFEEEVNWEEILSLGEKQRLAMARLLYHKPKFAILDECTSAVTTDMEQRLFCMCRELNITCITISHRPALRRFHQRMLSIGDGKKGFKIENVSVETASTAESNSTLTSPSSVPTGPVADPKRPGQQPTIQPAPIIHVGNRETVQQFFNLVNVAMPGKWKWNAAKACAFYSSRTLLHHSYVMLLGRLYAQLFRRDRAGLARYGAYALVWLVTTSFLEKKGQMFQSHYITSMRIGLSNHMLTKYLDTTAYYKLKNLNKVIEDPEQRLTDNMRQWAQQAAMATAHLPYIFVDTIWFCILLRNLLGWRSMLFVVGYAGGGIALLKMFAPNYKQIVQKENALVSKYTFEHARVRTCSESIAFFGGGKHEQSIVDNRFQEVVSLRQETLRKTWLFNLVNEFFLKGFPENLAFAAEMNPNLLQATQNGSGDAMQADAAFTQDQQTIHFGIERIFESFSWLLRYGETLAILAGNTNRIHQLLSEMERLEKEQAIAIRTDGEVALVDSPNIHFKDLDLLTPNGQSLAKGLHISVEKQKGLMVTGPNASGKSSIFRILGGLWPACASKNLAPGSAFLARPCSNGGATSFNDIFLVPQRVYMVDGSLADQVTYPEMIETSCRTPAAEEKLRKHLELVGIEYLIEREGGWDAKCRWEDKLSLGEQQRISMARLFYHEPKFAVLDECTSAVSVDVEEGMYKYAHSREITCITLSQRLALTQFHTQELQLGVNTEVGWQLLST
eukprot:gnl/MRDRNA2_/MRDRNA2_82672_c0_seq3.p1 gnl/MRDRNA2_/MRDRNA2_82672_c0~~gnl/MRDRNA2_/MRDRNA2_82672_c0_seq3.p1  ORF type:complete len:1287 (+),score=215.03 gnl/MRDRNA2_/MRDRNA2_82672_c0_seq3:83-3943(+)